MRVKFCQVCDRIYPVPKVKDITAFFARHGTIKRFPCPSCIKRKQDSEARELQADTAKARLMVEDLLEMDGLPDFVMRYLGQYLEILDSGRTLSISQLDTLKRTHFRNKGAPRPTPSPAKEQDVKVPTVCPETFE